MFQTFEFMKMKTVVVCIKLTLSVHIWVKGKNKFDHCISFETMYLKEMLLGSTKDL